MSRAHGTNARYHVDRCRCRPCTDAATEYGRAKNRLIAYGRWQPYVDAQPAREHCRRLMAAGMGPKTIARASGVSHGSISRLLYGDYSREAGPSRRIRPSTEAALLAVRPSLTTLAQGQWIDSEDTTRRLQALVAAGYPMIELGRKIGMRHPANINPLVHGCRRPKVATINKVRTLYADLVNEPPPTGRTAETARRYAAAQGWTPPLRVGGRAWTGAQHDDAEVLLVQGGSR